MSYIYVKPNYSELLLIGVVAALQPIFELLFGPTIAALYNPFAVLIVCVYVGVILWKTHGTVLREWGLQTDNFLKAAPAYAVFTLIAVVLLFVQGWYLGNVPLPHSFWYVLLLYPFWGILQQFALQNLLVRNLTSLVPSLTGRALLVALLFGLVHLPSLALFIEAGVAGYFFVVLYEKFPNLYAIGIAHGIVGALVFYLILGQDQWEVLMGYFLR